MDIITKLANFVSGGLFKEIKEIAMAYLPPDMSPQQKLEYQLNVEKALNEKQIQTDKLMNDAVAQFNQRIKDLEGTVSDLKSIPILGPIMLFLRGCQRPFWGFSTLYLDSQWLLSSKTFTDKQDAALLLINFLVLGFLFGERTLLNLQPLITRIIDRIFGPKESKE